MQVNFKEVAYASAPQYNLSSSKSQGAVPMFQDLISNYAGDEASFSPSSGVALPQLPRPFGSLSGFSAPV